MRNIIFCLIFLNSIVYAISIPFSEEKYIYALQTTIYDKGSLEIEDDFIKLTYFKKNRSYLFYKDHILLTSNNKKERINYEDSLELTIFFKIIDAIYNNKTEELKEYFKIKTENSIKILTPNEYLLNAIKRIEYQKKGTTLKFLKIYFINEDWINIAENS